MQQLKHESANMTKKIELLERSQRWIALFSFFSFFSTYFTYPSLLYRCFLWTNSNLMSCFRKLLGHDLSSCSIEELQEIDSQLERSLRSISARKVHVNINLTENGFPHGFKFPFFSFLLISVILNNHMVKIMRAN